MTGPEFTALFDPAVDAVTVWAPLAIGAIVGVKVLTLALPWAIGVVRRLRF